MLKERITKTLEPLYILENVVKWIVKIKMGPRSRCLTKLDNGAGKRKKTDERQGCEVELTRGRRK